MKLPIYMGSVSQCQNWNAAELRKQSRFSCLPPLSENSDTHSDQVSIRQLFTAANIESNLRPLDIDWPPLNFNLTFIGCLIRRYTLSYSPSIGAVGVFVICTWQNRLIVIMAPIWDLCFNIVLFHATLTSTFQSSAENCPFLPILFPLFILSFFSDVVFYIIRGFLRF